jgi:hypothetical protein
MKAKMLAVIMISIVAISGMVGFAFAGKGGNKKASANLYLYEKDPTTWEIVEGAWGKMTYNVEGPAFDFVFNGHGLEPGCEYTLIYYPDPWPGVGMKKLGDGTANAGGNVHIAGCVETGDLPIDTDKNDGAKIWLVLTDDVNANMIGWTPAEYLFENNLITFDDTD